MSLEDWGGGELLVDNSIYARRDHSVVAERWQQASADGQLVLVAPMLAEVVYSARNGDAARQELADLLLAYDLEPITPGTWDLALRAQAQLARVGNGYQRRFSIADLLTAALAHQTGLGVLHYDRDFDDIEKDSELVYRSVWAASPPSLDSAPPSADQQALALRKSLRLLLGTLDDVQDAELLGVMYDRLAEQVREAGLKPAPRLRP